jgi:hypothetical protein
MLKSATITACLLASTPAYPCHIYSMWHYKKHQHCEVATHIEYHPLEDKSWYVEIVLTPKVLDEISHGLGIEKIKQLQEKNKN